MMRDIVVNGRFLTRSITGVERYGREILSLIGDRCRVESPGRATKGVIGHAWEQFVLPGKLDPESVLWSPANTGPLANRNQALTIHDLSSLEHPEWFHRSFAAWYRLFLPILAKRVRTIFVPSEYVKRKVIARFHVRKVVVTSNGVNRSIFHPQAKQGMQNPPKYYILFMGSLEPRKNLKLLLRCWNEVKDQYKETWLIIAGAGRHVFKSMDLPGNVERVGFPGYIEEKDLPGLYANATLLVLPSFDEGFGLPALEAMACGTPVIVSDGGALPEVVGDAGLIFNLREPDGLLKAMKECLGDENLRLSLKEKGLARAEMFSWPKTADLIWKTLNEI